MEWKCEGDGFFLHIERISMEMRIVVSAHKQEINELWRNRLRRWVVGGEVVMFVCY
jgi:hypothetical protein